MLGPSRAVFADHGRLDADDVNRAILAALARPMDPPKARRKGKGRRDVSESPTPRTTPLRPS